MAREREHLLFQVISQSSLDRDLLAFLTDRRARGLSPRTLEYYEYQLHHLTAYLEGRGVREVQDVTADHIRAYLLHLAETRNAGGVHIGFRTAKTFLRFCWTEYELQGACPIAKVHAPKLPQEALRPLPLSDLQKMLDTCERHTVKGDRDRALLLCLLDSGCRASEFLALDVADVDLSTGALHIRHGKGGKARVTFIGSKAMRELLRWLRHRTEATGPLWTSTSSGQRLTRAGLRGILEGRARAAGVPAPSAHSFRRAFALASLRSGLDLISLQRLLGHADLSTLRRYLAQSEQDLAAAHQAAGPVDHLLR